MVADRLDVVSVRIEHEGPVVGGVIDLPYTRRPVVLPSGGYRLLVEGVDRGAFIAPERNVDVLRCRLACGQPEVRSLPLPKPM